MEVTADSLYEAVILGACELRKQGFVEEVPGPAARLEVEVKEPVVRHTVTIQQVTKWLAEGGTNPNLVARKRRLKELLAS